MSCACTVDMLTRRLPGFVFRGQILSITLAGVLLGLVLVREWIQQHNWTENLHPENDMEEINPDEWMVRRGIAVKLSDLFKDNPPVQTSIQTVPSPVPVPVVPIFHAEPAEHGLASTTETAPSSSSNTSASGGSRAQSTAEDDQWSISASHGANSNGDNGVVKGNQGDENVTGELEDNDDDYEDEDGDTAASPAAARPNGAAPAHVAYVAPELLGYLANEFRQQNARDPLMDAEQLEDLLRRMELHLQPDAQPAAEPAPAAQQGRGQRHRLQEAEVDEWGDELEEVPFEREDWDGILEVIGLIGPWQNLFQNVSVKLGDDPALTSGHFRHHHHGRRSDHPGRYTHYCWEDMVDAQHGANHVQGRAYTFPPRPYPCRADHQYLH